MFCDDSLAGSWPVLVARLDAAGTMPRWAAREPALTGMAEPLAALAGVSLVIVFDKLLPLGLAFAAGAMTYVVFDEIIPESYRRGHREVATLGALAGFILMTTLEQLFT